MKIQEVSNGSYVVLVTGSRNWTNEDVIRREFSLLPKNSVIVHGACRGADAIADMVADSFGFRTIPCPAHWSHNGELWSLVYGACESDCKEVVGKAAGVIRNSFMLDAYLPSLVIAFHEDIGSSRGTKHMVEYAVKKGFEVKLVEK